MSNITTAIKGEFLQYIIKQNNDEEKFFTQLLEDAQLAKIAKIHISVEQAAFMQTIINLAKVKTIVEVGTLAGYSALKMAQSLPDDGFIYTIESNEKHAKFAQKWFNKSLYASKMRILLGDGLAHLESMQDNSCDCIFIDADKVNYINYIKQAMRIVKYGGLILVDNAFAFGQVANESVHNAEVNAIRDANDFIAQNTNLQGGIVPFGDGFWLLYNKKD